MPISAVRPEPELSETIVPSTGLPSELRTMPLIAGETDLGEREVDALRFLTGAPP